MEQTQPNQEAVAHRGGGAKTEEGKAMVSKNAIRHGLLSREVLLKAEDASTLDELRQGMVNELTPVGTLESFLVDRLVADTIGHLAAGPFHPAGNKQTIAFKSRLWPVAKNSPADWRSMVFSERAESNAYDKPFRYIMQRHRKN